MLPIALPNLFTLLSHTPDPARQIVEKYFNCESPLNKGMYTVVFQIPVYIKMLCYPKSQVTFGAKLKAKRLEAGYSLKEFSRTIGVSETSVIAWERHNVMPFERNVKKIFDFLGAF